MAKDLQSLRYDLHKLKQVLFHSIGIIGIRLLKNPDILMGMLYEQKMSDVLYHIQKDVYVIICRDLNQQEFQCISDGIKVTLHKRCNGAVSIYDLYSCDDPRPGQMIRMVMKLIQANQDMLELNEQHREMLRQIREGNYLIYLQPKANNGTGKIIGAEALVRYRKDDGSIFPPSHFIPQLEKEGLIYYVDLFIFEQTCRIQQRWKECGYELYPISLNFSRITLMHEDLIEMMEYRRMKYGVEARWIEIEITESVEMMDMGQLKRIANEIIAHGYRLSLDDFGVSFSNISILSLLKFDTLKIDRSIVEGICQNSRLQTIIKGLFDVCDELNIDVVAEGIEHRCQMETLLALGCNCVQGYLIGHPVEAAFYEKLYRMRK